jgi:hypothetical protein
VIGFVRRSKSFIAAMQDNPATNGVRKSAISSLLALVAPPHCGVWRHVDHAATCGSAASVMPTTPVEFAFFVY